MVPVSIGLLQAIYMKSSYRPVTFEGYVITLMKSNGSVCVVTADYLGYLCLPSLAPPREGDKSKSTWSDTNTWVDTCQYPWMDGRSSSPCIYDTVFVHYQLG